MIDQATLRGKCDYAMVTVLLGCGLRRAELAGAQVADLQQREEHWVFADLIGKGDHIRTVPIPDWVAEGVGVWLREAGVTEGAVFRAINKAGRIAPNGFSPKVIWVLSNKLLPLADWRTLRRMTFAAHAGACVTKPAENSNRFSSYSGTQRPDDRTVSGLQTATEEYRQRQHRP
jgi:integrase